MNRNVVLMAMVVVLLFAARATPQPIEEFGLNAVDLQPIPDALPVVSGSGARWVRLVAYWRAMEPVQGQINFADLDANVEEATDLGLGILINFISIPSWANGAAPDCDFWAGECSAPPTSSAYFASFVQQVVDRYRDRVQYWEIWNEPDYHVFWDGTIAQWVDLIFVPGAVAAKAIDPSAMIVGPSTYSNPSAFQQRVSQICSHLDVVSHHFYLGSVASMFSQVDQSFLPWIAANCNRPLWVTETGIDSWLVGEQQQASEYVAAIQGAISRPGLQKMFLFHWCDAGGAGWGLTETADRFYRPKRSFFEVKDFADTQTGVPNYLVLRDTFANTTTGRPVGALLNGTSTEFGARPWQAQSTVTMGVSEVSVSEDGAGSHIAGVAYGPTLDPDKPEHVVEADVIVVETAWIAVGFSSMATGGFWGAGTVWAHLGPTGTYAVYADGLNHLLAAGSLPSFVPSRLNRVRVRLQQTENVLSVDINEATVLQRFDLDTLSYSPSLAFAGFHIETTTSSTAGTSHLDNFRVFARPESVVFADGFETGSFVAWSVVCTSGC